MPTVTYRFVSSDQNSVVDAFKSVASAARASAVAARSSGTATAAGSATASRALQQEATIAKKLVALRVAESKAALDASKAAGVAFDKKLRDQEKAAAAFERNLKKEVAAFEREEKRKADIAQRESTRRERAEQRAAEKISQYQLQTLGRIAGRVGGAVTGFGMNLAGRATDLVGSAVRDSLQLSDLSNQISVKGRLPGQAYTNPADIQKAVQDAAIANAGTKATDIAEGVQEYLSKTGDLKTGLSLAGTLATGQSATGTNAKDLASTVAALNTNFDFQGIKDFQQAIAVLSYQGKQGAFELEDAASQFTRLSAAANAFNIGKGGQAVATLGGLSQIAFKGTGNARAASTAVQNIFGALVQHSAGLHANGVDVYAKDGGKRDVRDVLIDVIAKTGGNDLAAKEAGLSKLFGKQGIRAINPLYAAFSDTFRGTKGSDSEKVAAASEKLRQVFAENIDTVATWSDVEKDAAQSQDSNSAKVTQAMEILQAKVASDLVPALVPLIGKLPALVDALGPVIDVFTDLVGAVSDVVKYLEDAGVINTSPEAKQRRAQRELDKFNSDMGARIGPMSPEEMRKKEALEYQVKALGKPSDSSNIDKEMGKTKLEIGAAGAGIGYAIGGAPGSALGGSLAYGTATAFAPAAEEQARQAISLRQSGLIETASGGFISTDGKSAREAAGKPEIKTEEANKALEGLASTIQAAISRINSSQQPSLGSI